TSSASSRTDEAGEQRPVAPVRIDAGRRAEERDALAGRDAAAELVDEPRRLRRRHLLEVARAVGGPRERRPRLAVVGGVERAAGAERRPPFVPGLVGLADAARPVAADEEPVPVVGGGRVVPALRADGPLRTTPRVSASRPPRRRWCCRPRRRRAPRSGA